MTNTTRLNPFELARKIEQASAERTAVTARWDLVDVGVCPACKQEGMGHRQMQLVSASGIPSFVCVEHCVCLPAPDEIGATL